MHQMIHDACLRLPNLESLALEDRPLRRAYCPKRFLSGLASAQIYCQTRIDLRETEQHVKQGARKETRSAVDGRRFAIETTLAVFRGLNDSGAMSKLRLYNMLRTWRRMYGVEKVAEHGEIG